MAKVSISLFAITLLVSRVEAALLARFSPFQEVLTQSAHAGEIYDENSRLCGELTLNSSARFRGMLASSMKSATRTGEIDLKTAGLTASATAEVIHLCAAGLKQGAPDVAAFEKRLHRPSNRSITKTETAMKKLTKFLERPLERSSDSLHCSFWSAV